MEDALIANANRMKQEFAKRLEEIDSELAVATEKEYTSRLKIDVERANKDLNRLLIALRFEYDCMIYSGVIGTLEYEIFSCKEKVRKQKNIITNKQHLKNVTIEKYKTHKMNQLIELQQCLNKKLANYEKYNLHGIDTIKDKLLAIDMEINYTKQLGLNCFVEMNEKALKNAQNELDIITTKLNSATDDIHEIKIKKIRAHCARELFKENEDMIKQLQNEKKSILEDIKRCDNIEFYIASAKERQQTFNTTNPIEFVENYYCEYLWNM